MAPPRTIIRLVPLALLLALASCARRLPVEPLAHATAPARAAVASIPYEREVVALLRPGVRPQQMAADYGVATYYWSEGLCAMETPDGVTPADLLARLVHDPRVEVAEPDIRAESPEARQESFSFDDGFGSQQTWAEQPAGQAVHLDAAHLVATGAGIKIAILDTGIDPTHPAFAHRLVPGYDFLDNDPDPTDVADGIDNDGDGLIDEAYGHGTHVAGIVALAAPQAKIMMLRVLNSDGRGDVFSVGAGLRWAMRYQARVINMSLGMLQPSLILQHLLAEAEAQGIVCVASAGNWGAPTPEEFPASSPNACAVAAVNASLEPAPFSSFGSFVSVSAPGVGVRSAYPGGGWRLWSGTSMACPFVSGTAALVMSRHPQWSPAELRARIAATVQPVKGVSETARPLYGEGVLDAAGAVGAARGAAGAPAGAGDPADVRR